MANACYSQTSQPNQQQTSQGSSAKADDSSSASSHTPAPESDLKSLPHGSSAVFKLHEATATSVDVANGKTTAAIKVKAHDRGQSLADRYLQTATGSIVDTNFPKGKIQCDASSEVSGTITFGSGSLSEVRWNNWDYEATWILPAKQVEP